MRDRQEIEREIFEARQDLEETIDRLIHRLRERAQVRARAKHAVGESIRAHPVAYAVAGGLLAITAVVLVNRARR